MLPSAGVGVGAHPWEPLGQLVESRPIIQNFIPASRADRIRRNSVGPLHLERERLATGQCFGKINAHHGSHDGERKILAFAILDVMDCGASRVSKGFSKTLKPAD